MKTRLFRNAAVPNWLSALERYVYILYQLNEREIIYRKNKKFIVYSVSVKRLTIRGRSTFSVASARRLFRYAATTILSVDVEQAKVNSSDSLDI